MKSHHDEYLVRFLKQHQPLPPPAPPDAEEALFALITDEPSATVQTRTPRAKAKVIWLIPTAIAAGVTLMWGRYQSSVLAPTIADYDITLPVMTAFQADVHPENNLESYLEAAWGDPFADIDSPEHYYDHSELMSTP